MPAIKDQVSERVAQTIKARRERLGLTLRDLAATSGISSSMISDVERGAKSPTVATLSALAEALGIPVPALFEGPAQRSGRIQVSRATKRSKVVDPASGAKRDAYRPVLATSKVEFVRYVVPARTQAGPFAAHAAGTIEHLHLATGSIRVMFGSDSARLKAGDCCTCVADAPHAFDNRESDVEALMYIVVERP
jgi:transcriptional regulator with XRE-family HTH domain